MEDCLPVPLNCVRTRLRETLAQPNRWQQLPALLDAIDASRREAERSAGCIGGVGDNDRTVFWVDRFAHTLRLQGSAVDSASADRTAQALLPWLGAYDPVALARGRWVDLPKSYG